MNQSVGRSLESTPLLATKLLAPPVREGFVPRPRLTELLDQARERPVTIISAPAGYGKTSLVSEWVQFPREPQPSPMKVAWLSLDRDDNDPTRFLTYLVAALQSAQDSLGDSAVSLLRSPQIDTLPSRLEYIITLIINDLAAMPFQVILVLDDYHIIESLEIQKAIAFLVDHIPPQLHLVIISREDPMLSLHRLQARGQVTEIRANHLRFTQEEAALFLSQTMDLNLTTGDVATLERRTEGWPVGLQMAALSLKDSPDPGGSIAAFAGDDRYVMDYLVAEVLAKQPRAIQEFLLKTAILDSLSGPLCDAVIGGTGSWLMLTELKQSNLFVVPLDHKHEWYRYHQLFQNLLRHRLREQVDEESIQQLHRNAADWYQQSGFFEQAIQHRLVAGDLAEAADLVESICADLIWQSHIRNLLGMVAALPDDLVRARPWLDVHYAWAMGLTGRTEEAALRLEGAERNLGDLPTERARVVQGQIGVLRSYDAHHRRDPATAIGLLLQALACLPEDHGRERCIAHANLGINYLHLGELFKAREAFSAAKEHGQAAERVWLSVTATSYLADTFFLEGQLGQAAQLYREAIQPGEGAAGRYSLPPTGHAYAGLGRVLYERGRIREARLHLRQAVDLGSGIGFWGITLRALGPLAWLEHNQGNSAVAQTLIQQALDLAQQVRGNWSAAWWEPRIRAYQILMWLTQDQPEVAAAARWTRVILRDVPDVADYATELIQLAAARLRIVQGRHEEALLLLRKLAQMASGTGRMYSLMRVLVLQSLAYHKAGSTLNALDALEKSLDLAEPEGCRQTILDEGVSMAELLAQSRHTYATWLLAELEQDLSERVAGAEGTPPVLQEPLNAREIELLRHMASGFTNAEIARATFLSVNTVKWHAKNLYSKLQVHRRAQAVARARELGLIP